jgi:caa(3)-type oxidase subunit IV
MDEKIVELTPAALQKAKDYIADHKKQEPNAKDVGVRVLTTDGKLGLSIDEKQPTDKTFEVDGVLVLIEPALYELSRGLKVDFDAKGGGFAFSGSAKALDPSAVKAALAPAATHGHGAHGHGEGAHHPQPNYMRVFYALIVLTAIELMVSAVLSGARGVMIFTLIVLAVAKAVLVALYFMHLKFEGRWKHIAVIPPLILAMILVFALMPDIGFPGWFFPGR